MPITILHGIRPMPGHTKSNLMRADDGHFYVVKCQNNPLGRRALINDWIASNMAIGLGLDAAKPEIVQVSDWLLRGATKAEVTLIDAGPQFGSRFVSDPQRSHVVDYMPEKMLDAAHLTNIDLITGAAVFDLWVRNVDYRQFVYYRTHGTKQYTAMMIDHTGCLGGTAWNLSSTEFPSTAPPRGALQKINP